jgi:hypothetical protein
MLSNFEDMILLRRQNLIARKDFPHPLYLYQEKAEQGIFCNDEKTMGHESDMTMAYTPD